MRNISIIFRKELKDIFRDRRSIMMMIGVPVVFLPLIIVGLIQIQIKQEQKAAEQELIIAVQNLSEAPGLEDMLLEEDKIHLNYIIPHDSILPMVKAGFLEGAIIVEKNFMSSYEAAGAGKITVIYPSSEPFSNARRTLNTVVSKYNDHLIKLRLEKFGLDESVLNAVNKEQIDASSLREKIASTAGGFIPYLVIIFGFMGAMFPGLDLGAGEKERGTLETLVTTPVSRFEIVLGKLGVVVLSGCITSVITLFGAYNAMNVIPEIPPEIKEAVLDMFSAKMIIMLTFLLLPTIVFFSSLILSLSIYARSYREAQSIVAPLNLIFIFPAIIGTVPGMELDPATALVPILNVSLATKMLLSGNPDYWLVGEVLLVLLSLAGFSLAIAVWWFRREETLFRS